jgi:hypothetical protein
MSDKRALMNEAKAVPEVTAGSGYVGPNQMITWIRLSEEQVFHQYFFEAPIDESHTRIFFVNMRTFMLEPENDGRLVNINLTIAQEDIDLLETLDPVDTPDSSTEEVLVPSDGAVMSYRKFLKQWRDNGWRIDIDTMCANRRTKAYAIPCPARRTSGNWVLNPVPLISPAE